MTVPISYDDILGVTHLLVYGKLMRLLKCPFCPFRSIHEDIIKHHIQYREDNEHNVDVGKLDKKMFIVLVKKECKYHYENKENLPLRSIKCLWCNYHGKIERDLEWHFLENHKYELYRISTDWDRSTDTVWRSDPFSWMYDDIDYRLYRAVQLVKGTTQPTEGGER